MLNAQKNTAEKQSKVSIPKLNFSGSVSSRRHICVLVFILSNTKKIWSFYPSLKLRLRLRTNVWLGRTWGYAPHHPTQNK